MWELIQILVFGFSAVVIYNQGTTIQRLRKENRFLHKVMGVPLARLFKKRDETVVTKVAEEFRRTELKRDFSKNRFDHH